MRSTLITSLFLATVSQALVVTVGPGKQFATVGAAVNASLPLREDLFVLVAVPTGTWTTADAVVPTGSWNGYEVRVTGFKNIPTSTVYVEDEAVYEHNGVEMQEAYVNLKGLTGVEGRATSSSAAYYAKDHLGSTRMVLDVSTRQRLELNGYQSYGRLRPVQVSAVASKQKFTGKELDGELGLYYFGARYYDPELGMWISPDAARQFHSPYAYHPNPISNIDPDGNAFNPVGAGVGAMIGLRNMYVAQRAYYDAGGESYLSAVGVGLTAYGASVVAGGYSIAGEGALAIAGSTALVGAGTGAASSMLGQKAGAPNSSIKFGDVSNEAVKGGIAGFFGGLFGGLLGNAMGAGITHAGTGLAVYPGSKVAAEVVGQGVGQIMTEVLRNAPLKAPEDK